MTPFEVISACIGVALACSGGGFAVGLKVASKKNSNNNGVKYKPLPEEFVQHTICANRQQICVLKVERKIDTVQHHLGRKLDKILDHFNVPHAKEELDDASHI